MTRAALFILLALAAGGTFIAVNWLLSDSDGGRTTSRDEGLRGDPDPIRDLPPAERKRDKPGAEPGREEGSTLTGTVSDTAGNPVEGATVQLQDRVATTRASGRYEIESVAPTGPVRVRARGYFPLVRERAGAERLDFELTRAAVLFGTVTDESGQPVPKAQVYLIAAEHQVLDSPGESTVAETNEKGEYVFPGVAAGVTDIGVRVDDYRPQVRTDVNIAGLQEHRVDFVLARGRTVVVELLERERHRAQRPAVRIADSRLRDKLLPPGGLELLAKALPGRELVDYPVIQREFPEDGVRVTIHGLPVGPVDIEALGARRNPLAVLDDVPEELSGVGGNEGSRGARSWVSEIGIGKLLDNQDAEVKLRLLPADYVAPVVRDALTNDLLFPKITRFADDKGPMEVDVLIEKKIFVVPVDPRRHTLRFEMEGYDAKDVELPADRRAEGAGAYEFEVLLQPLGGTETGSLKIVFEPKLEGPEARLGVMARGESVARQCLAKRGPKGDWIVEKIPVGTWDLTLLPSKMIPVKLSGVAIVAGATQEVRVTLQPGGGMELKVVDAKGELLDKVGLKLLDPNDEQIDIHFVTMVSGERGFTSINHIPSAATARTDSGLAPGTYTLWAGREGYEVGSARFTVAGTDVAEVTVVLERKR